MRTYVDTYGIAVGPEEIHWVGGEINELLQGREWEAMRRLDNGAQRFDKIPSLQGYG